MTCERRRSSAVNVDRVATMNGGVVDQNSITLSSTHAGHSNDVLVPAGYLITPSRRRRLLQSERIGVRSGRGFSDLPRTRPPAGGRGWCTTSWWTGPWILLALSSPWAS